MSQSSAERRLEVLGLLLALLSLAVALALTFAFLWYKDPGRWYYVGRTFGESFATRPLAYGFPLLVFCLTGLVGPVWGYFVNNHFGSWTDAEFIVAGFHGIDPEGPAELAGRWTGGEAALRFFSPLPRSPVELVVSYLTGLRPASVAAPQPRFLLNGHELAGSREVEQAGAQRRVTRRFEVSAERLTPRFNTLVIESETWVPSTAAGSTDSRSLGIFLEPIRVEARPLSLR